MIQNSLLRACCTALALVSLVPAAPAAATSDGEEDPFDSIFKIFNSK